LRKFVKDLKIKYILQCIAFPCPKLQLQATFTICADGYFIRRGFCPSPTFCKTHTQIISLSLSCLPTTHHSSTKTGYTVPSILTSHWVLHSGPTCLRRTTGRRSGILPISTSGRSENMRHVWLFWLTNRYRSNLLNPKTMSVALLRKSRVSYASFRSIASST
jgi:hypothetical protein